ncbi:MAG TPA: pitrilysin family protein [Candidatus Saccharimonadales bacterium]|nr:pitrilysin family protein [Candidatus Saccharimonadales bacterium]
MKEDFEKITLENGLRVILAPLPAFRSVTALILCGAGSRYETKATNGISHFLEHMFFKGTKNRPSASDISHALDELGADYNAFTGKENTGYHIKAASQHLPLLLDMLSDMLWNSVFDEAEIEKEKGVIIEELNLYEDTPMRKVGEVFEEVLWGDQPLGWEIGGRKEVIKKIGKADFAKYIDQRYVPSNMVLAISGDFKKADALKLVQKNFGHHKDHAVNSFLPIVENQTKPSLKVSYKKTDQAHLVVGFRGLPLGHGDRYNAAVLGTILGGGMSSRLFVNVREKRGLAYYVRADHESYLDTGTLSASAGVDLKRIDDALKVTLSEFAKIAKDKVEAKELKKAKEYIKGKIILAWEDSRTVAFSYGGDELLEGEVRSVDDYLKRIDAVTAEDILRVAQFLVTNSKLNLAVIGPFKDPVRFQKILKV